MNADPRGKTDLFTNFDLLPDKKLTTYKTKQKTEEKKETNINEKSLADAGPKLEKKNEDNVVMKQTKRNKSKIASSDIIVEEEEMEKSDIFETALHEGGNKAERDSFKDEEMKVEESKTSGLVVLGVDNSSKIGSHIQQKQQEQSKTDTKTVTNEKSDNQSDMPGLEARAKTTITERPGSSGKPQPKPRFERAKTTLPTAKPKSKACILM